MFTTEQLQAVNLRNKNILVSAAAGSGKTAVLVERIIQMITDLNSNIDIDKLIVVTFTNAAAAEMRERINKAIEQKLLENPDNSHLQKQHTLIHNAQITTIHSFCLNIIRNNFNYISLDPSFRIADQTELDLLKTDIISELLEAHYMQQDEIFFEFIESYSNGKNDDGIVDLILQLYEFSQGYPSPQEWLNSLKESFTIKTVDDLEHSKFISFLLDYIKLMVNGASGLLDTAINICNEDDGPSIYYDALIKDKALINKLNSATTYQEFSDVFNNRKWAKLSSKRDDSISPDKRENVKFIRAKFKDYINNIDKIYFFQTVDEMIEDTKKIEPVINLLIDLVIEFSNLYSEAKRAKNILDFNDLEHGAFNILLSKSPNGAYNKTPIAKDLSDYYDEIIIDEYQDINLIQELLLNSISKEYIGKPNTFMVGDVKQSIYKFRLARPEIFLEKYNAYSGQAKDSLYQLIDLHKNFRSRLNVLNSINFIFSQLMDSKLGGIDYDKKVALYKGADFSEDSDCHTTELLIIGVKKGVVNASEGLDYTQKELEAKVIAQKIKDLVDNKFQIYDINNKSYRDIKYSDIVILLRTVKDWSDVFENVLMKEGIPSRSDVSSGYFSTIEVQTVISFLNILDNPIQDIPLTTILKSPVAGLTSEELATLKAEFKNMDMYNSMINYIEMGSDDTIRVKLEDFKNKLDRFRKMVPYTPIHELIWRILNDTDYYNYISAMPSGERRKANIDMLIERAIQYEATSYKGLFNFIRYIDKIKEFELDLGQSSIVNENENIVRIMSIHKSKGLEFPVVFVSGLGKKFNNQDSKNKIVISSDLGIGSDYIDYKLRTRSRTLIKSSILKSVTLDNLSEELRILYVALTRAKEKLILTGYIENPIKHLKDLSAIIGSRTDTKLPFVLISSSIHYLDWILQALIRSSAFEKLLLAENIHVKKLKSEYTSKIEAKILDISDLLEQEIKSQITQEIKKDRLLNWEPKIVDNEIYNKLNSNLNWNYKYYNETQLHTKMTITELKRLGQNIDNEESDNFINELNSTKPKFISGEDIKTGALVGTIVHKIMQNINLESSYDNLKAEIDNLVIRGLIPKTELKFVNLTMIYNFLKSNLAQRMIKADKSNKLFKEKQFTMYIKANDINPLFKSNEFILVQGIIDAFFEEDNEWVLLDYKTDKVTNSHTLIKRYSSQLEYYKKAIEQLTKKNVKQKLIYSFALNREIRL